VEATAGTGRQAAGTPSRSRNGAVTTAQKSTASSKPAVKGATTSTRKAVDAAADAAEAGAAKVGD
jgi:hypothetical protein